MSKAQQKNKGQTYKRTHLHPQTQTQYVSVPVPSCEFGENTKQQIAESPLPEDDLIKCRMACIQLLLLAFDATEKQQHERMLS